jgi:hypothetical protein
MLPRACVLDQRCEDSAKKLLRANADFTISDQQGATTVQQLSQWQESGTADNEARHKKPQWLELALGGAGAFARFEAALQAAGEAQRHQSAPRKREHQAKGTASPLATVFVVGVSVDSAGQTGPAAPTTNAASSAF